MNNEKERRDSDATDEEGGKKLSSFFSWLDVREKVNKSDTKGRKRNISESIERSSQYLGSIYAGNASERSSFQNMV
jgi:hypothetical protein